ncbi:MAG: hypothetical protein AAGA87_11325 [Pseudomonadota bacterium]
MFRLAFPIAALTALPALADTSAFEGLYYPEALPGWSCRADALGSDGGAVGVRDGKLEGVENSCELLDPTPADPPGAVAFKLRCMAEGEIYEDAVTLQRDGTRLLLRRDDSTVVWEQCP